MLPVIPAPKRPMLGEEEFYALGPLTLRNRCAALLRKVTTAWRSGASPRSLDPNSGERPMAAATAVHAVPTIDPRMITAVSASSGTATATMKMSG